MRYAKKPPKANVELSEQLKTAGWKKILEPKSIAAAIACSAPFALLLGALCLLLIYGLNPALFSFLQRAGLSVTISINLKTVLYVLLIFVIMLLHEFLHLIFIPSFVKSQKTYWGINGLFGFVFTTEPIRKWRYILISVMPFILLSIILPALLQLLSALTLYAVLLCVINALGSCVDFLNVSLIVFQVPNGHTIISNGLETWHAPGSIAGD